MNKLVFLDWSGPEQTFNFVGWNSSRAASDFLDATAYVIDENGRRNAVQLRLPFLQPFSYRRDPFPQHPPTRIEKFRLIPPPCRATKAEADQLLKLLKDFRYPDAHGNRPKAWEAIYGEVLYPTREDDSELTATLNPCSEEQKNFLHTPFTDADERSIANIRNDALRHRWAKEHSLDLSEMAQDNQFFLERWAELKQEGDSDVSWAPDALLALVCYRIHFADGGRFWLSGCQLRDLQTPEEQRDFDALFAVVGAAPRRPRAKHKRRPKLNSDQLVSREFVCEKWGGIEWARVRQICRAENLNHQKLTESEVLRVARLRTQAKNRNARNLRNRTRRRINVKRFEGDTE